MLLVDLADGEPTEFAERGVRAQQADEAARILGVERLSPGLQDRFLADTRETRLQVARLILVSFYAASSISAHPVKQQHAAAAVSLPRR